MLRLSRLKQLRLVHRRRVCSQTSSLSNAGFGFGVALCTLWIWTLGKYPVCWPSWGAIGSLIFSHSLDIATTQPDPRRTAIPWILLPLCLPHLPACSYHGCVVVLQRAVMESAFFLESHCSSVLPHSPSKTFPRWAHVRLQRRQSQCDWIANKYRLWNSKPFLEVAKLDALETHVFQFGWFSRPLDPHVLSVCIPNSDIKCVFVAI